MRTFEQSDLRYTRKLLPNLHAPLDLIEQDLKNGVKPLHREAKPRYSPLREHVSSVVVGPDAPDWLVVRLLADLMPPIRRATV